MPHLSDEEKLARLIGKGLDTMQINYHMIVANFLTRNSGIQKNMFELILAFLNKYASLYVNGDVTEQERMYSMCVMSHRMLSALDNPAIYEDNAGRHCAP